MHDGKPWAKRHARRITGSERHKAKMRRYDRNIDSYPSPVYLKEKKNGGAYLKRLYRSGRAGSPAAVCAKICNRKVRRCRNDIASGGSYKRIADYWWMLY